MVWVYCCWEREKKRKCTFAAFIINKTNTFYKVFVINIFLKTFLFVFTFKGPTERILTHEGGGKTKVMEGVIIKYLCFFIFCIWDASKWIYWQVEQIRHLTRIIEEIENGKPLNEPKHVQVILLNVLIGEYSRRTKVFQL